MDDQIFNAVILGLVLNLILWAYGLWQRLNWTRFFRENYLLPLFLFVCGLVGGVAQGQTVQLSLLFGFILAVLITLMFGVRFHSELALYRPKATLSLGSFFNRTHSS